MSAPARLATFVVALILVFGASYLVAGAVVPDRVVDDWTRSAQDEPPHDATTDSSPHGTTTDVPARSGATDEPVHDADEPVHDADAPAHDGASATHAQPGGGR